MIAAVLSPELAEYQRGVMAMRASSRLDYPGHVHLETLALCNAACSFCPYPDLDRKGARMDDALIEKIIDDLCDIPRLHPFQLSPFKVNEPFLDPRLFDLLATVNERLPNATLTLTTNASPVTEATLGKLSKVHRLGYLWVSMNDHREAEYEAVMQLPYARTIERLRMMHDARADGRLTTKVILSRVGDGTRHDLEFRAWVAREWPLFQSSVFPRSAWVGQVDVIAAPPPDVGCQRWFDVSITATGVVAHCCSDGQARYPLGDVTHEHVLDVYNKPAYRALRETMTSRMQVHPCRGCGFL